MNRYESHSPEETARAAAAILKEMELYAAEHPTGATVVGLSGHLGAGKTALTKIVAQLLGVTEVVTSPTFVIMKLYPTTHAPWKQLVHIDAYRLERHEELEVLQFEKLLADPHNLIIIEWPEHVGLSSEQLSMNLFLQSAGGIYTIEEKTG